MTENGVAAMACMRVNSEDVFKVGYVRSTVFDREKECCVN